MFYRNLYKVAAVILAAVMLCACASGCALFEPKKTDSPTGTDAPAGTQAPANSDSRPVQADGDDMEVRITGNTSPKAGDTVVYTLTLVKCSFEEGLLGIDLVLEYNKDLFDYEKAVATRMPSGKWEFYDRDDGNGIRTLTAFDDDVITPAVNEGDYTVEITMKCKADGKQGDMILHFTEVSGAKNDKKINMAYGTGYGLDIGN